MLIHQLGLPVAAQQDTEIVKPSDYALQFNAVDQKNCDWNFSFTHVVQECILKILSVRSHYVYAFFLAGARVPGPPLITSMDVDHKSFHPKKRSVTVLFSSHLTYATTLV